MDSYFKNNIHLNTSLNPEEVIKWENKNNNYLSSYSFLKHFNLLNRQSTIPLYITHPKGNLYGHIIKLKGKKIGNYYKTKNNFSLQSLLLRPFSLEFFCFGNTHLSNVSTSYETPLKMEEVVQIIERLKVHHKINFFLLPDHFLKQLNAEELAKNNRFHFFESEPVMAIEIPIHWKTINDYLADIKSKYKKRYRSIIKKSKSLKTIEINLENIDKYITSIKNLYSNVYKRSSFSGPPFNVNIFSSFLADIELNFKMKGYLDCNNNLIAFSSYFIVDQILYSYYIGLDYTENLKHNTYNRMLYDKLELGIKNKVKSVIYGRTAHEFKSTIGAIPSNSKSAVYISNSILNLVLKPFVSRLEIKTWVQRDPFKKGYINT